jgi:hypothetical protein
MHSLNKRKNYDADSVWSNISSFYSLCNGRPRVKVHDLHRRVHLETANVLKIYKAIFLNETFE